MRPNRPILTLEGQRWAVQITDDQSRTLIDSATGIAFHSASGGLAETTHVYLENSGVAGRIEQRQPTSVLEIGLGFGMGMLLTLDMAVQNQCSLHYAAVEQDWLHADVLRQLELERWLQTPSLAEEFYSWRESLGEIPDGVALNHSFGPRQSVTVHHQDARTWQSRSDNLFDAIYFDPFAPEINPDLWTTESFQRLHQVLRAQGRLVTYCVNRQVRESLEAAGFEPNRVPGPKGGKRQVMVAIKTQPT